MYRSRPGPSHIRDEPVGLIGDLHFEAHLKRTLFCAKICTPRGMISCHRMLFVGINALFHLVPFIALVLRPVIVPAGTATPVPSTAPYASASPFAIPSVTSLS